MSGQSWKRHVAAVCSEAWALDARATAEVVRCVEDIIDDEGISDSESVQVFLSVANGEPLAGRTGTTIKIRISC